MGYPQDTVAGIMDWRHFKLEAQTIIWEHQMALTVDVIGKSINRSIFGGEEMNNPYYLSAFMDEEGQRRPFSLKIEGPFSTSEKSEFYCRVESPELLGQEFNVYGDSGGQTKELAFKLIEFCLKGKKIYDAEGNALVLEVWE